jgi:hypothetical protein
MKRLLKKFEDIMVAVTFAEAGEYEMAKKMSEEVVNEDEALPAQEEETETA